MSRKKVSLTVKQEKFCYVFVLTGNASHAYREAYNTSKMKAATVNRAAHELLQAPKITARIAELRAELRKDLDVTIESLTSDAREGIELAKYERQPSSVITGVQLIAKLHGLLVDKKQVTKKKKYKDMDEVKARINELLEKRS